ncbi:MAG: 2Fe-2S iron-sulfur cluster-binding protein [Nitrospinota bacterium]
MSERLRVRVYRFDPTRDREPRYDTFEVPRQEGMVVGDALEYIYEHCDGSLAFRYECRTRQCGTCCVEVDGQPSLFCMRSVKEEEKEITVEPMSALPVVRDLVTDSRPQLEKLWGLGGFRSPIAEELGGHE